VVLLVVFSESSPDAIGVPDGSAVAIVVMNSSSNTSILYTNSYTGDFKLGPDHVPLSQRLHVDIRYNTQFSISLPFRLSHIQAYGGSLDPHI